jgi:multimeric flavodoxin WrbA
MTTASQEQKNPLIVLGSSRSEGNTWQAIQACVKGLPVSIVDLKKLHITPYDYAYGNQQDDFIPLAEKMISHNPIILATPIYWYTMSAIMKIFMDRWSDLIDIRKDLGRALKYKDLYVIASYAGSPPKGFEDAFIQTCEYLSMQYKGCFYFYSGHDPKLIEQNSTIADKAFSQLFNDSFT